MEQFVQFPENTILPEAGRMLLSEPFLNDGYFRRAVVFLVEHNAEGSLGFILNKPMELHLNDVISDMTFANNFLYMGGPVGQDTLHILHMAGNRISGSRQVAEGIFWGGDFEEMKSLVQSGELHESEIRFFLGYSGWSKGQLSAELKEKSWFVLPGAPRFIFGNQTKQLWEQILKEQGQTYRAFANFPVDPLLN